MESAHLSSCDEGSDVADGEGEVVGVDVGSEGQPRGQWSGATVDKLHQQPVAKDVLSGSGQHYNPNRYRLHFESEPKEEIEKRKRLAKSDPVVPLPDVSSNFLH